MPEPDQRSVPELIATVASDLGDLVRKESELLRSEMSEKISTATKAVVGFGAGAVLLLGAFLCLLAAAVLGLSYVIPPAWAALVVAAVTGLIGVVLVTASARKTKPSELKPEHFTDQVRRDTQMIKEQIR
jgi:Flp pilus assembly protein TadB